MSSQTNSFPTFDRRPGARALPLLLIGVDHRSAPIELREKVAYGTGEARALLRRLVAAPEIAEAALLSTCNRTELYLRPAHEPDAYRTGLRCVFLERAPEIEHEGRLYVKRDEAAARHLLEVACGLRSMVLGEPEVLGQVRQAALAAREVEASGAVLDRLLRTAVRSGRRARSETAISAGAVSFGYAVVELTRRLCQRLEGSKVLLVGAGETSQQVARYLVERGACELLVSNRSRERAETFLSLFPQARRLPFEHLAEVLSEADVVVASTAAERPVIRAEHLAAAFARGRRRPLLVVDLGVPRNVEPPAEPISGLTVQDIDSLEGLISRNLERRREEAPKVGDVVDDELGRFAAWYAGRGAETLVASLQERAEALRRRELESSLARFPPETHPHLERLTRALVRKLLHHPTEHLRSGRVDRGPHLDLVRELFRLDDES